MPLITLTPGQFKKRRPKGDYQAYLRHIDAARAGRPVGRQTGKQVALPLNPNAVNQALLQNIASGYLNPKQMRQQAVQSVNDAIKTALGDLRSTTAAAQKQATDQARAYEGFARTLAEMRREDAGYVRDLYSDAAGDQARFAQALTGEVGAAAQADAAAQQADIAAATGQTAGYQGTNVPAMTNVGYFLGGQLPAASLRENAAYLAENELRQGLAAGARLGMEGAGMRQKAIDLQAELARERLKLTQGRPKAIREAMDALADDQRANLATLANVLYLQNTQAKTTADLTGMYQGQPTINTYRDASGRVRQYNPNTHRVKTSKNGTQFLEPLPQPKGSSSSTPRNKAGFTPSQQATQDRMRNEAIQTSRSEMLKALQNQKGPLWTQPDPIYQGLPGYVAKRRTYSEARQYLMTNFANDLIRQYPGEQARILRTVDEVLASAGFKKKAATKPPPSVVVKPRVPTVTPPGGGFRLPSR